VLAGLCVLLGIFPQLALRIVGHAIEGVTALPVASFETTRLWGGLLLVVNGSLVGCWAPLVALGALAVLGAFSWGIQRAGASKTRSVPVWYCGEEHDADTVRYPASSFYLPFKHAFQGIYPSPKVHVPRFPAPLRRALNFDQWLYTPATNAIDKVADRVSRTHVGIPQIYLLWIVIGAILVTGILVWVRG
jgi:hypothetical protein